MKPPAAAPRLASTSERDLDEMSRVHALSFAEVWNAAALRDMLEMPGAFGLVCEESGHAAGFVLLRIAVDEAEIITFAVLPSARRRGLGRNLLEAAGHHAQEQGALSLVLEVDRTNDAALRLYRAAGFEELGVRPAYYVSRSGSGDALVMRAGLPLRPLGKRGKTD